MRKAHILAATAVLGALVLAGCGGGGSAGGTATGSSVAAASPGRPSGAVLKTAKTALGTVVVDAGGRTVYYFDKDTANSGKSACSGACLNLWPPVKAGSASPSVDGVTGTVGTITRADGTKQLTLDGRPLYLYAGDAKPGDTTGQGVQNVWWVVAPDGSKITAAPSGGSY